MRWIAALRRESHEASGTLLDALTAAPSIVVGDDVDDVVSRGRSLVSSELWCDIYQLPPNEAGRVEDLDGSIGQLSAYDLRRFTYRSGSGVEDIRQAEQLLDLAIPERWTKYLTSPSVLHEVHGDQYLHLYTPAEIGTVTSAFYEWSPRIGAVMIADDGASDRLQLDTRRGDQSPVVALTPGGQRWADAYVQVQTIDEFITVAESGRFEFRDDVDDLYRPRQ